MRNVLDERPDQDLHGHARFVSSFVDERDLADKDVLDIGCGFGWFELLALEAGVRSVIGIEPTEHDLATARRHFTDGRVRFEVGTAAALPFAEDSFDTVAMWEVLEHIPMHSEPLAFREIARVLRPEGRLYLSTPHANAVARVTDPAWWVAAHRHYTLADVAELARDAGLEVETLERRGGRWQIVHMNNMYVSKWLFRRRPFLERRSLRRLDADWDRTDGFVHVFLKCRKSA